MKQFLAFKSTPAYGENKVQDGGVAGTELAATPDELAEGAIGIFALSGSTGKLILVDTAAKFADVKEFIVARGLAKGAVVTDRIERKSLGIDKTAAVSAVAKAITISTLPANLPAGTVVDVVVVDNNATITTDHKTKRYSYRTKAANETATVIGDGLRAAIAAHKDAIVVASGTTTLVLTHKVAGKNFHAYAEDQEGVTLGTAAVTTKTVRALGDVKTLEELQLECHGYQGGTRRGNLETGDLKDYNLIDKSAGAHVMYNLIWTGTTTRLGVPVDAVASRPKKLFLAIPTGAAAIATLDTMLAAAALEEVAAQAEETGA